MAIYADTALAQFENTNALRLYPFAEGSSFDASSGKELPRDVVVDLSVVVPADIPASEEGRLDDTEFPVVRLTSVHISPFMVSVCFRSEIGGMVHAVSSTVSRGNFEPYRPYRLEKLAGSYDIGGAVTFGDIDFPGFPETYFMDRAVVHPCCVSVARPARLRSIVDLRSGTSVSGDVDIGFSGHIGHKRDGKSYSLFIEDDSRAVLASECDMISGSDLCGATPIVSINGVSPDKDGNIVLWFH